MAPGECRHLCPTSAAARVVHAFDASSGSFSNNPFTHTALAPLCLTHCRYDINWAQQISTVTTATDPRICNVSCCWGSTTDNTLECW